MGIQIRAQRFASSDPDPVTTQKGKNKNTFFTSEWTFKKTHKKIWNLKEKIFIYKIKNA